MFRKANHSVSRVVSISALTSSCRSFSGDASAPSTARTPTPLTPKRPSNGFRAGNVPSAGSTNGSGPANPYKSWEHMNHTWMILMCLGALAAGTVAGKYAEVDESKLNVAKFEKSHIVKEMRRNFEVRPDLAATILRVTFVLAARRAGCQAECIDESCAVVEGLGDIAGIMRFSSIGSDCTIEDMVSLASIEAIRFLRGPYAEIDWKWGRQDLDKPKPRLERKEGVQAPDRPKGLSPTPWQSKDERGPMLPFEVIFKAIDPTFTDAEIVALMGTHSVGESHEHVSGAFEYQRSPTRFELDNMYYKVLLAAEKKMGPLHVGRFKENEDVRFLPEELLTATVNSTEINGARKKSKRPIKCIYGKSEVQNLLGNKQYRDWVVKYAADEALWSSNFQSAWQKLIDSNVTGKLRPYVSPAALKTEALEEENTLPK